jgi:hypothetical protein
MSITISIPSSFADGILDAEGAAGPRQLGFACVVGIAWIRGSAGAEAAAATWADAERREPHAVDVEPQIYCVRHGGEHAAKGLAPCSDIGCAGCERRA